MPRLIWVFAGRTCHFVGFVMRWLRRKYLYNEALSLRTRTAWSGPLPTEPLTGVKDFVNSKDPDYRLSRCGLHYCYMPGKFQIFIRQEKMSLRIHAKFADTDNSAHQHNINMDFTLHWYTLQYSVNSASRQWSSRKHAYIILLPLTLLLYSKNWG